MAEVVLVRWPAEYERASQLLTAGAPLLYLIGGDDDPPDVEGCLADWVRLPGDSRDIDRRVAILEQRAALHTAPPRLDDNGLLHYRGRTVSLLPGEARLATVLIERFGSTVSDDDLAPRTGMDDTAGVGRISPFRTKLRDAGLTLRRSRCRGYQLVASR